MSGRDSVQEKSDRIFKIKEMQNSVDNIILENSYMKLWFSGTSGLLEVCCIMVQNTVIFISIFVLFSGNLTLPNYFNHVSLSLENKYKRGW